MTGRSLRVLVVLMVPFLGLGCSAAIHHGLDEAAANEVVSALARAGISADKQRDDDGAFRVSVGQAEAVGAIDLLRSLGLPRPPRAGLRETFEAKSLIPSQTEERARYGEALASDIARTLETLDGVALARVHLVLPEADVLAVDGRARVPAQAAVLLKLEPGHRRTTEADVQKLVAGSVPGLAPTAVAVVSTVPEPGTPRDSGLVTVGPWRMDAASRSSFLGFAAGVLMAGVLLAGLVLVLARRLAAAQRKGSPQ